MKIVKNRAKKQKSPVIEFRGKKYRFSTRALILFPVGIIILTVPMIQFFKMTEIIWLHELFAKHTVFFLNLIFNLGAQTMYLPIDTCPWDITIPGNVTVFVNNGCTGLTAMTIFVFVIICTPHSQDPKTNEDILWRKTIDIIVTLILIYFFNVFRAVIQIYLYSHGFAWDLVHDSLGTLSIIIATHISIFLFCNICIPEFYVSIYYSGKFIYKLFRKECIAENFNNIKKIGQYNEVWKLFKKEGIDLNLIKMYEIDSRLIQFLKKNNQKYTTKAIKVRLFDQQEKVTEDLLEKVLLILVNVKVVLSENFSRKIYYFI
jgi:exosortase/archaeosortase family protein